MASRAGSGNACKNGLKEKLLSVYNSPLARAMFCGFVLVAALESVFLIVLSLQVFDAEKGASHEYELLQSSAGLSRVIQLAQKAFEGADEARKKVGDPEAEARFHSSCNTALAAMAEVVESFKKNGLDTKGAERLRSNFAELVGILDMVLSQAKAHGDIKTSYRVVLNNSGHLYTDFVDQIKAVHGALESDPDSSLPRLGGFEVKQILYLAAAFNLLLCLCLLFLVEHGISAPLSRLSRNCDRMVGGELLPPPKVARNEISSLEQSFHEMSQVVSENEKRRRNFIEFFQSVQRASLQKVRSCFDKLLADPQMPERAKRSLEKAKANLFTLLQLLQSMTDALSYSSQAKVEARFEPCSSAQLIAESDSAVEALLQKRQIKLQSEGEDCLFEADPHLIKRVLVNFLSNAIKYSPEGALVRVLAARKGDLLRISIIDRGPGIAEDDLHKLFKEFSMLNAADGIKRSGSGLGLLICKQIAEAHAGQVGVESKLKEGSTFWIELPLNPSALLGANKAEVQPDSAQQAARKSVDSKAIAARGLKVKFLVLLLALLIPQSLILIKLDSMFAELSSQARSFYFSKERLLRVEELLGLYLVWKLDVAKAIDEMEIARIADTEPILKEQQGYCRWIIEHSSKESLSGKKIREVDSGLKKLKKFGQYLDKRKDDLNLAVLPKLVAGARKIASEVEDRLFSVLDIEQSAARQSYVGSQQIRSDLLSALSIAALLNIVLLAVVAFLALAIIEKIAKLKGKAQDFARGEDLQPSIKGKDELAFLDRHLCEIALAIRDAEQQRQKLIAVINHDLRTPLSSIVNTLQLVLSGGFGELSPIEQELSSSAEDELERLLQQINDLLLIEKIDAGLYKLQPERFELLPLLTSTARSFESGARRKGVKLVPAISRDCRNVCVSADRSLVEREIAIIMSNAINAAPVGSQIDVCLKKNGDAVAVSVKDQGSGIEEELLPQIFERFRFMGGKPLTGLGLPLAHRLSNLQGGSVSFDSTAAGTEMRMSLPIA